MTSEPFLRHRHHHEDIRDDFNEYWWTTSGGSTFIPSGTEPGPSDTSSWPQPSIPTTAIPPSPPFSQPSTFQTSSTPASSSSSSLSNPTPSDDDVFSVTTSTPIVFSEPSTTFTSFSQTVFLSTRPASALPAAQTGTPELQVQPVCIGDGLDAQSLSLIATIVVPSVIGLVLWVSACRSSLMSTLTEK